MYNFQRLSNSYYQNIRLFGVLIARNIMTVSMTLYNILSLYNFQKSKIKWIAYGAQNISQSS